MQRIIIELLSIAGGFVMILSAYHYIFRKQWSLQPRVWVIGSITSQKQL